MPAPCGNRWPPTDDLSHRCPLPGAQVERAAGSFLEWAYFHYGRWALGTRGWWAPEMKPEEEKPRKIAVH